MNVAWRAARSTIRATWNASSNVLPTQTAPCEGNKAALERLPNA